MGLNSLAAAGAVRGSAPFVRLAAVSGVHSGRSPKRAIARALEITEADLR